MKIIDLVNKIAKGEEVPKKFINKHNLQTYELINYPCCGDEVTNYKDEDGDYLFGPEYELLLLLNDEVEIIEPKKIEKLDVALLGQCDNWLQDQVTGEKNRVELNPYIINNIRENTLYFQIKINQLIDVINDMRDKE